ncbi:MAG: pro-sigmaK processing inhibitor BofA family protein [Eubacteriales bacterium]
MKETRWSTYIFNFILRAVLGVAVVYFANTYLESTGSLVRVGLNAVTLLTSGTLGLPGVAALYGITFYQSL